MIGLLEIGIRATQEHPVNAETSVSGIVATLPASPVLLEAEGAVLLDQAMVAPSPARILSSSRDKYSFATVSGLAIAGSLSHLLPARLPRFARSQECARLREGKSPLKASAEIALQAQ